MKRPYPKELEVVRYSEEELYEMLERGEGKTKQAPLGIV